MDALGGPPPIGLVRPARCARSAGRHPGLRSHRWLCCGGNRAAMASHTASPRSWPPSALVRYAAPYRAAGSVQAEQPPAPPMPELDPPILLADLEAEGPGHGPVEDQVVAGRGGLDVRAPQVVAEPLGDEAVRPDQVVVEVRQGQGSWRAERRRGTAYAGSGRSSAPPARAARVGGPGPGPIVGPRDSPTARFPSGSTRVATRGRSWSSTWRWRSHPAAPAIRANRVGERLAGGPAQDFVEQVAVGQGVLGDASTGRMDRGSLREQVHERLAVVVPDLQASSGNTGSTGLVGEQVPHRRGLLAGSGRTRARQRQPAGPGPTAPSAHGVEERQRGKGLGDREGHHQGVRGPRRGPVSGAGAVVDLDYSVSHQSDGATGLLPGPTSPSRTSEGWVFTTPQDRRRRRQLERSRPPRSATASSSVPPPGRAGRQQDPNRHHDRHARRGPPRRAGRHCDPPRSVCYQGRGLPIRYEAPLTKAPARIALPRARAVCVIAVGI